MPLQTGARLGTCDIIEKLGAGGMGEVYRARDTRLNRDVAIKVLPDALSRDPDALARFEREAQAVAALSHPNILAIHDFATQGAISYAITELLEGETLRARMGGQALPVRKAVEYGIQIVRGIAAAHERGIVHRDLKPENIFVTRDGVVKILDFGLAKASATAPAAAIASGETRMAQTAAGMVMGTVGYMSPEQVRAQPLDHRTDIFSFGAIFYEMLTGRRAFSRDSHVETMNAILKEDPPEFADINPNLPGSLDRIVRRCLEKLPDDRFHSAHDLAIALEALSGTSHSTTAAAAAAIQPARRKLPLMTTAAVVLVGGAAFIAGHALWPPPAWKAPQFQQLTYRRGLISSSRMMPDATTMLYSAVWDGGPLRIYSARVDSPDSAPLPYEDADIVSTSSKGELALIAHRHLITGFTHPGTLQRATLGGASRDILENVQDADWLPDGTSFVVTHLVDGKFRLEFPIGHVVYETTGWMSDPHVARDGKTVAFLDHPILGDDRGRAAVVDGAGHVRRISSECESTQGLAWAPDGTEIWFTCAHNGLSRGLEASTLDGTERTLLRVPGSLVLGGIAPDGSVLVSHDIARRGAAGMARGDTRERDLSALDWTHPAALSADGSTLLSTEEGEGGGPGYGVFMRKLDGSPAVRLGSGEAMDLSADGKWVIAQRLDPPPTQLILLPTGAGDQRMLTNDDLTHDQAHFLPDGKRFVFVGAESGKAPRVWVQDLAGGTPRPITPEGIVGILPTPDGTRVLTRDKGIRMLYPVDGKAAPEPMKFIDNASEAVLAFASNTSVLIRLIQPHPDGTVDVSRLDLATGARTFVRTIRPVPEADLQRVDYLLTTPDGSAYVQAYGVTQSDLYLVRGLR